MVRTSLLTSFFKCRFCEFQINTYVGVLCHELDSHAPHVSCIECDSLLGKLSGHNGEEHAFNAVTNASCGCCGEKLALGVDQRKRREEEEEPGDPALSVGGRNLDVKNQVCYAEEESSVDLGSLDAVEFPISTVSLVKNEYSSEDATQRDPSPKPSAPEDEVAVANEFRRPQRRRYQYIPMKKINLIPGDIDAVLNELEGENGGLYGQCGLLHDSDESVFSVDFVDVTESDDKASRCADEVAADLGFMFGSKLHDCLTFRAEKRDRKKPSGPKEQFLCSHCALPFGTRPALAKHVYHVHGDDAGKMFGCNKCDKKYKYRNFLVRHCAWMRLGKKFKCKIRKCDLHFASTDERVKHVRDVHGGIKCDYCGERFVQWDKWRKHIDAMHDDNKEAVTCRICQTATFTQRKALKDHELKCRVVVNDQVRSGNQDTRRFAVSNSNKKYVMSDLAKAKRREYITRWQKRKLAALHKCNVCCRRCYTEERRLAHEENCHLVDAEGLMSHKCEDCDAVFPQVRDLNEHTKTHPGSCDYKCPQCPKQYFNHTSLTSHLQKDHVKKRWVCEICGKEWMRKHQYLDHKSKHEGKPRHTCEECGEKFYFFPTFYDHRRKYCPILKIS